MWGLEIGVVVGMIAINSVFAAYEIALASVSSGRLAALAQARRGGAAAAVRMKQNMEGSLAVVQLGITLVGVIAAATGGAGAEASIEPALRDLGFSRSAAQLLAILLVVAPLTAVTIVFGELVPKVFALRNKEWVCLRLSPPMEWFSLSVWPAVWALEKSVSLITRWSEHRWKPVAGDPAEQGETTLHELRAIAALARTSRLIGNQEEGIIVNAVRLSGTSVRSIMLPAAYISTLNADDPLAESLIRAHKDMHTRFPVVERPGDPQTIIGYVNFKDIVATLRTNPQDPSLRSIVRWLPSFRDDLSVSACLERMIHERNHIALIRDEAGQVVGMFTLEDILEELIGEIHDEYDRLPSHISKAGNGWIVGGHTVLSILRETTGLDLTQNNPQSESWTISHWVSQSVDGPLQGGEIIERDGLRVVVRKVRRQVVMEAYVGRAASPPGPTAKPGRA